MRGVNAASIQSECMNKENNYDMINTRYARPPNSQADQNSFRQNGPINVYSDQSLSRQQTLANQEETFNRVQMLSSGQVLSQG